MGPIRIDIEENNIIYTYDVSIDDEILENFNKKIIDKASYITHHNYTSTHGPFNRKKHLINI